MPSATRFGGSVFAADAAHVPAKTSRNRNDLRRKRKANRRRMATRGMNEGNEGSIQEAFGLRSILHCGWGTFAFPSHDELALPCPAPLCRGVAGGRAFVAHG